MTIAGRIRRALYQSGIDSRRSFYAGITDPQECAHWQLGQFNRTWADIIQHVPYYAALFSQKKVPAVFRSWQEFFDSMPVQHGGEIQQQIAAMQDRRHPVHHLYITGGSSGQPRRIPAWRSESHPQRMNQWWGRSWAGINPQDPCFLLWGHAHLYGYGFFGELKYKLRQGKDRLLGYTRWSGYDLSKDRLNQAAEALLQSNARYILGYAYALDLFARFARPYKEQFKRLGLKAVIATAENLPHADSRAVISDVFDAPLIMEYGSNETGALAYTDFQGTYHVFWRDTFMEVDLDAISGQQILRVTSLYPRCVPLIRYELGDHLNQDIHLHTLPSPVLQFNALIGRATDVIRFPDGSELYADLINQVVRDYDDIIGCQWIQDPSSIQLHLLTQSGTLSVNQIEEIRAKLTAAHPYFAGAQIQAVRMLQQTRAGKTPLVIGQNRL